MARNLTKIIPAVAEDKDWIKEIYRQSKKELGSFDLWQSFTLYLKGVPRKKFFSVIKGKAFVYWGFMPKYKMNVVIDIGVDQGHKRKGYGLALLKFVPKPFMLKCNQDNVGGNAFYKGVGMRLSGETATKKGVKQNVWVCVEL